MLLAMAAIMFDLVISGIAVADLMAAKYLATMTFVSPTRDMFAARYPREPFLSEIVCHASFNEERFCRIIQNASFFFRLGHILHRGDTGELAAMTAILRGYQKTVSSLCADRLSFLVDYHKETEAQVVYSDSIPLELFLQTLFHSDKDEAEGFGDNEESKYFTARTAVLAQAGALKDASVCFTRFIRMLEGRTVGRGTISTAYCCRHAILMRPNCPGADMLIPIAYTADKGDIAYGAICIPVKNLKRPMSSFEWKNLKPEKFAYAICAIKIGATQAVRTGPTLYNCFGGGYENEALW